MNDREIKRISKKTGMSFETVKWLSKICDDAERRSKAIENLNKREIGRDVLCMIKAATWDTELVDSLASSTNDELREFKRLLEFAENEIINGSGPEPKGILGEINKGDE